MATHYFYVYTVCQFGNSYELGLITFWLRFGSGEFEGGLHTILLGFSSRAIEEGVI